MSLVANNGFGDSVVSAGQTTRDFQGVMKRPTGGGYTDKNSITFRIEGTPKITLVAMGGHDNTAAAVVSTIGQVLVTVEEAIQAGTELQSNNNLNWIRMGSFTVPMSTDPTHISPPQYQEFTVGAKYLRITFEIPPGINGDAVFYANILASQ